MMLYPWTPIGQNIREVAVSTTRAFDNVKTRHGRLLYVSTAAADVHARWSEDKLLHGDFEAIPVWADVGGVSDVEGAALRKSSPWRETGTSGAVTLNKTGPLEGLRDAKMALDSAATRLYQRSWMPLRNGVDYALRTLHKQSNAGSTIDVAIRHFNGTLYRWRDAATTFSDTETWITLADATSLTATLTAFRPESDGYYEVLFRPTGAAAGHTCQIDGVFFGENAVATDLLLPVGEVLFEAQGEGRFSFIKGATTGTVTVAEAGVA